MASPYAAAHADPQGPGDARPTALQIIEDQGVKGRLDGKVIVITGATSGIVRDCLASNADHRLTAIHYRV